MTRSRLSLGEILALLLCCFGIGCNGNDAETQGGSDRQFNRGDRVVVETSAATFFEGRVLAVASDGLRVQGVAEGEPVMVAAGDAYALPSRSEPQAGGYAVCHTARLSWVSCRVEVVSADGITARTADDSTITLEPADVLVPTPVTQLNVSRLFERTQKRAEFQRAAVKAGGPRAPPGWRPEAQEQVIVRRDGAWYTARAEALDAVSPGDVVPLPPYDHLYAKGDYALIAPKTPVEPWRPVRVDSIDEDHADVVDERGDRSKNRIRDLVPFSPR